jgi:vancomycin resistance protein VanJ
VEQIPDRIETTAGPVGVYVIHAASARLFAHQQRDTMLASLAQEVAANVLDRVLVVGDLNAGTYDHAIRPLRRALQEANQTGGGFGFTWPADLPMIRLDHIFFRGLDPLENNTIRVGTSDHLAVRAEFRL